MLFINNIFKYIFYTFIIVLFFGCGYKPTYYYAKNEINGKVYIDLKIDIKNAANSVLVKDAVNEMIVSQFGTKITNSKKNANTIVEALLSKVSFTTLQGDNQGYAKLYRTSVLVVLKYTKKGEDTKTLTVEGSYDYSVSANSLITDAKKEESVKIAAQKALGEIFSKIAIESFKKKPKTKTVDKKVNKVNIANPNKSKSFFFFKQ